MLVKMIRLDGYDDWHVDIHTQIEVDEFTPLACIRALEPEMVQEAEEDGTTEEILIETKHDNDVITWMGEEGGVVFVLL